MAILMSVNAILICISLMISGVEIFYVHTFLKNINLPFLMNGGRQNFLGVHNHYFKSNLKMCSCLYR